MKLIGREMSIKLLRIWSSLVRTGFRQNGDSDVYLYFAFKHFFPLSVRERAGSQYSQEVFFGLSGDGWTLSSSDGIFDGSWSSIILACVWRTRSGRGSSWASEITMFHFLRKVVFRLLVWVALGLRPQGPSLQRIPNLHRCQLPGDPGPLTRFGATQFGSKSGRNHSPSAVTFLLTTQPHESFYYSKSEVLSM